MLTIKILVFKFPGRGHYGQFCLVAFLVRSGLLGCCTGECDFEFESRVFHFRSETNILFLRSVQGVHFRVPFGSQLSPVVELLGALMEPFWHLLGSLGASWSPPGALPGPLSLGPSWEPPGTLSWGPLGALPGAFFQKNRLVKLRKIKKQ